jgi:leucyl aminopeptidase
MKVGVLASRAVGSLFVAAVLAAATASASPDAPVEVVQGKKFFGAVSPDAILHRDGDVLVLRTAAATAEDFTDLYVVNMHLHFAPPADLESFGQVLDFVPARLAVMRLTPASAEELAGRLHGAGLACGVLLKLDGTPIAREVAPTPTAIIPTSARDVRVERLVAAVDSAEIAATLDFLTNIHTRYHTTATGGGVAQQLADRYEALAAGRSDITISTFDHGNATPQDSLVVRIAGTTRPSEVIVLGSHLDSVNWRDGTSSRAPGADDNASGTATNLEIFRQLMAGGIRPERTVEIHAYAAEEIGLVGSQDMATKYKNQGVNVVAMVQHDMTLWKAAGAPDKIWFVTSNTDDGFNTLLAQLVDGYVGLPWGKAALSGGSSDHASWRRAGFSTSFPFENPTNYNGHIHTAGDTVANSGALTQAAGFAKLGLAYVLHFGGIN